MAPVTTIFETAVLLGSTHTCTVPPAVFAAPWLDAMAAVPLSATIAAVTPRAIAGLPILVMRHDSFAAGRQLPAPREPGWLSSERRDVASRQRHTAGARAVRSRLRRPAGGSSRLRHVRA